MKCHIRVRQKWKAKEITVLKREASPGAARKKSSSKVFSTRMELAVHRLRQNQIAAGPNLGTATKSSGSCERFRSRRSELIDLFEVAVQEYIASDRG
jgi:hypothetical protein